jgi:hypothetical protein
MPETSLYPAVKRFLERAGFSVKGEVNGCDVVAIRDGEPQQLVIVEMKLGFNLDLLLQAIDRMRSADEVWLAVPATRRGRDRDPRVHRLCRLIGFGLMAVNVARDRIEVLTEPGPYRPRPDQRRRAQLLSEHARRTGDLSPGGSTRQPVMTAYRQQALACAALLQMSPCRPRDLRAVVPDAGRILLRNVYGWFERIERGVYRLTNLGELALQRWPRDIYAPANAPPRRGS